MPKQSDRGLTAPFPQETPKVSGVYRAVYGNAEFYAYYSKIDNKWYDAEGFIMPVKYFFIRT